MTTTDRILDAVSGLSAAELDTLGRARVEAILGETAATVVGVTMKWMESTGIVRDVGDRAIADELASIHRDCDAAARRYADERAAIDRRIADARRRCRHPSVRSDGAIYGFRPTRSCDVCGASVG